MLFEENQIFYSKCFLGTFLDRIFKNFYIGYLKKDSLLGLGLAWALNPLLNVSTSTGPVTLGLNSTLFSLLECFFQML